MIYEYIISCYRLLSGMLQMRNFMSFVIITMCILSRFFAIMCRVNSLMGDFYNLWMKEIQFPSNENESSTSLINLPLKVESQSYLRWGKKVEKSKLSKLLSGNHQEISNQTQIKEEGEKKLMEICDDEDELGEPVSME